MEAARVMDQAIAVDVKPAYLYAVGGLWPRTDEPDRALPHLPRLIRLPPPKANWFAALAHVWLQSDDPPAAAAAMEAPAGLDPSNGDPSVKLIRLYRVAGAPK